VLTDHSVEKGYHLLVVVFIVYLELKSPIHSVVDRLVIDSSFEDELLQSCLYLAVSSFYIFFVSEGLNEWVDDQTDHVWLNAGFEAFYSVVSDLFENFRNLGRDRTRDSHVSVDLI
jgi:hypothetical protein